MYSSFKRRCGLRKLLKCVTTQGRKFRRFFHSSFTARQVMVGPDSVSTTHCMQHRCPRIIWSSPRSQRPTTTNGGLQRRIKKLFLAFFAVLVTLFIINDHTIIRYFGFGYSGPLGTNVTTLHGEPDVSVNSTQVNGRHDLEIKFSDTVNNSTIQEESISVAIGLGITTRSERLKTVTESILFTIFMPSFCRTASEGYRYTFYVAFDFNDPLLTRKDQLELLKTTFSEVRNTACRNLTYLGLNLIKCSHTKNPAWAQNDAMMSAYMDDNDYYYRVNDDTIMHTVNWTERFIERLSAYDPPNVGVVGPNHSGGNTDILTYDFVHRSHVDVFGFYYPRDFPDWYADDWITDVYKPNRSTKLRGVTLTHTMQLGQRYLEHLVSEERLRKTTERDKDVLRRYIAAKRRSRTHGKNQVIAMSLVGDNTNETYGVVRNIMLQPIYFPTWTVRIYLEQLTNSSEKYRHPPVPNNVIVKLKSQLVQLVFVTAQHVQLDPSLWPILALDDPSVDYLLVRKPTGRLSDRDAAVVTDWLRSGKAVHVIKDHPSHSSSDIVPGLWGVNTKELRKVVNGSVTPLLTKSENETDFLNNVLWPQASNQTLLHDSANCSSGTIPSFPMPRVNQQYLGQDFGAFGEVTVHSARTLMRNCPTQNHPPGLNRTSHPQRKKRVIILIDLCNETTDD